MGKLATKIKETRLEEELREAIESGNIKRIGDIVDLLRFSRRANYEYCYELAARLTGISAGGWDELLYEADQAEEE